MESTRRTRSATRAPAKAPDASRSPTPTKTNRTNDATATPLPESDGELSTVQHHYDKTNSSGDAHEIVSDTPSDEDTLTEDEVKTDGSKKSEKAADGKLEESLKEDGSKDGLDLKEDDDVDGTKDDENVHNNLENKHGAQAKLQEALKPMTPAERMKSIRKKAKDKADAKEKALTPQRANKTKPGVNKSKKQKRAEVKKAKKACKKNGLAAKALKAAENKVNTDDKEIEDLTNEDTEDDTPKGSKEVIEVNTDGDIEEISSSEDEQEDNTKSNPYSALAQETRKRKSAKKEEKRRKALVRPYDTYYTLKLKIEANSNPAVALRDAAGAWLIEIKVVDPTIVVYGYKDLKPTYGITRPSDIPKGLMSFKEFFVGANARADEGHVWANIWIGHALDKDDLFSNFKCWLRKHDTSMYVKKLQEKNTVREYFLLWSSSAMSEAKLIDATTSALERFTNEKFKFAFPWAIIRKEDNRYASNEAPGSLGKQYVRALHIEVAKENAEQTYRALNQFFGSRSKVNILYRRLRMVPVLRQSNPQRTKDKINQLIEMQRSYNDRLDTATSYDLVNIDTVRGDVAKSLRQIIMQLRALDGSDQLVFTSIDYEQFSGNHVLTFPKMLKSQAWDYATQLPSFLHWLYGDPILILLTSTAVERALETPWSEEDMCAISKQDLELDEYVADGKDICWMQDIVEE